MEEMLNAKDVMKILRCSYSTLGRWEKKGVLNPIKLSEGARKLYDPHEIRNIIKEHQKKRG